MSCKNTLRVFALVFGLVLSLTACDSPAAGRAEMTAASRPSSSTLEKTGGNVENGNAEVYEHYTLIADFSNGASADERDSFLKTKEAPLPPNESEPPSPALAAFYLADALSEWTCLFFSLNDVSFDESGATVDWSKDSTLVSGLDGREQKEGFRFFDAVSLNWFMMDSLADTLKENLHVETVRYCSDGKPIAFPNPEDMASAGLPELPADLFYEGSAFFAAHSGERGWDGFSYGELSDLVFIFSNGAGAWRTELRISSDGTFSGDYTDADMEDAEDDYPEGTLYVCNFSGKFGPPVKTGDFEYSMAQEGVPGDEEILDGVRIITSEPYGFDNASELKLYLPGKSLDELPAGFIDWVGMRIEHEDPGDGTLSFYGLYNTAGEQGFSA
jgi:hypothetical protein